MASSVPGSGKTTEHPPSSPVLKSRKTALLANKQRLLWYLLVVSLIFSVYLCWYAASHRTNHVKGPALVYPPGESTQPSPLPSLPSSLPIIAAQSLTALLPVTPVTLEDLAATLEPLLGRPSCLREVLVLCPEPLLPRARAVIRAALPTIGSHRAKVSLRQWNAAAEVPAVLHAATHVRTEWTLLLDARGLLDVDIVTRDALLNPPVSAHPRGPRGILVNATCAVPSETPQPAAYLLPPFIARTALLSGEGLLTWAALGSRVAEHGYGYGGLVVSSDSDVGDWCDLDSRISQSTDPPSSDKMEFACLLQNSGHTIVTFVFNDHPGEAENSEAVMSLCTLAYDGSFLITPDWITLQKLPDVVLTLGLGRGQINTVQTLISAATVIDIPRSDLSYCEWMGQLELQEWKSWHVPQLDLTIITKDRPRSLERLLTSLSSGIFYGDKLSLRVNLEQSADTETLATVRAFHWPHGVLFVHHRVIHGGLLPAVVESWYPASNDTYGLLLEDDVELSPLFYAWIKMSILRYRYGRERSHAATLFGISLYQQKHLELRQEGRRPFRARELFATTGIPATTPYLSQIPCSWGAVYFPEHWREFHAYLTVRLAEAALPLAQNIVRGVRSNSWTRSWKRYFIELVHLRGYVMLYPNYAGFASLSTNHLEVGAHVRTRPAEKKALFLLPLMALPGGASAAAGPGPAGAGLLDLPGRRLPAWHALPVLNLTGSLTSLGDLGREGWARRAELTGCTDAATGMYDVRELMCIAHGA